MATVAADVMTEVRERVDGLDWSELRATLDDLGHAIGDDRAGEAQSVCLGDDACVVGKPFVGDGELEVSIVFDPE